MEKYLNLLILDACLKTSYPELLYKAQGAQAEFQPQKIQCKLKIYSFDISFPNYELAIVFVLGSCLIGLKDHSIFASELSYTLGSWVKLM